MISAPGARRISKSAKTLAMLCLFGMFSVASISVIDTAYAEKLQTTVTKLDGEISLEKTMTTMSIPENNTLPWSSVYGKVNDPAQGYPVIIQFFKSIDEDPIHVAQVSLKGDNSFEYKFRVLSIDDDVITHFYEGDYQVKIFKVINTSDDNLDRI